MKLSNLGKNCRYEKVQPTIKWYFGSNLLVANLVYSMKFSANLFFATWSAEYSHQEDLYKITQRFHVCMVDKWKCRSLQNMNLQNWLYRRRTAARRLQRCYYSEREGNSLTFSSTPEMMFVWWWYALIYFGVKVQAALEIHEILPQLILWPSYISYLFQIEWSFKIQRLRLVKTWTIPLSKQNGSKLRIFFDR